MDSAAVLLAIARSIEFPEGRLVVTTSKLGSSLGVSQQTMSRHLRSMESDGLIVRRSTGLGQEISLTKKAIGLLKEMHNDLESFLSGKPLIITGKVVTGLGEGAYYTTQYEDRMESELGFGPFSGTLNIVSDKIPAGLERHATITIGGFESENRKFGEIRLFPVELRKGGKKTECYALLPERTHHADTMEFVSKHNLRKKLGLKDGDELSVRILA